MPTKNSYQNKDRILSVKVLIVKSLVKVLVVISLVKVLVVISQVKSLVVISLVKVLVMISLVKVLVVISLVKVLVVISLVKVLADFSCVLVYSVPCQAEFYYCIIILLLYINCIMDYSLQTALLHSCTMHLYSKGRFGIKRG